MIFRFSCLIFATLILSSSLVSQVPFAPVGSEWFFHLGCSCALPDKYPRIFVDRDTIIEDKYCTIMEHGDGVKKNPFTEIILHDDNGKIYFYEDSTFYLMFDFSSETNIGDIIEYYIPKNGWTYEHDGHPDDLIENPYFLEVINVEYVEASDGTKLRKFIYDLLPNPNEGESYCPNILTVAIEGIGGTGSSIIRNHCLASTQGYISKFACFQNDEFSYVEFGDMCIISSTRDVNENLIHLFPNPSKSEIYINNETSHLMKEIKMFNAEGKFVGHYNSNKIDISNLNTGIYFVRIQFQNFSIRKKILKL